jgi:thiol:disulfide interchange protein DsbD
MIAYAAAAFMAGLATSVGPCVAPRYLALASLVAKTDRRRRWMHVMCFIVGLMLSYGLLGTTASLLGAIVAMSPFVYLVLALSFLVFGLRALAHESSSHQCAGSSAGSAVLTGGALGLVFSPCCAPVVGMMASTASASSSLTAALAATFAFAMGHVAPLVAVGLGLKIGDHSRFPLALEGAMGTISAGLALALACYYGILV